MFLSRSTSVGEVNRLSICSDGHRSPVRDSRSETARCAVRRALFCERVKAHRTQVPGRMRSARCGAVMHRKPGVLPTLAAAKRKPCCSLMQAYPGAKSAASSTKSVGLTGKRVCSKERGLSGLVRKRQGTTADGQATGGAGRLNKTNSSTATGKGRIMCSTLRGEGRWSRLSGWRVSQEARWSQKPVEYLARGKTGGALYGLGQKPRSQQGTRIAAGRKLAQLEEHWYQQPNVAGSTPALQ